MAWDIQHQWPLAVGRRKRRQLYALIRDYLAQAKLPKGSPLPSTHELARRMGVSYVTMHSALDDLTRDGWLVRQQGKGTFVAEGPKPSPHSRSPRLAMVLPPQEDIRASGNSEIVLDFVQGCTAGAAGSGSELAMVSLPSAPGPRDLEAALRVVLNYDGAIFVGTQFAPLMEELRRRQFPYVILAGGDRKPGCEVNYDQQIAVRLAVEHLVGHGYRTIGFLGTMKGPNSAKFGHFCRLLSERGITPTPAWFEHCPDLRSAPTAARDFASRRPLPEAVLVDNYRKAEALVRALEFSNLRVPGDLAVMAYGTEHVGGIHPPLSMVEVPSFEMGCESAELLDKMIRGGAVPEGQRLLQPRLVIRGSCGCPYRDWPLPARSEIRETATVVL